MRALPLLLAAVLIPAAPAAAGDGTTPPGTTASRDALPPSADGRLARCLERLRAPGGPAAVVGEAATGSAGRRRAALEALATLGENAFPEAGVPAALAALADGDAPLRRAAVAALVAAGPPAMTALEGILAAGSPRLPRRRAEDALFDLRRAAVEREFLAAWAPADGTYRGMYASLPPRGGATARVLTAIALDRRMAGPERLGYGPYAWFHPPGPDRERSEIRFRALDALADAGDAEAREALRGALRRSGPAEDLHGDYDLDPVPAALDDALRDTMAALGDARPLGAMMAASMGGGGRGIWMETLEMRRQARAYSTLAENTASEKVRAALFTYAEELQRDSIGTRRRWGLPVDGVDWYNLACVLARRDRPGDREEALSLLRDSVKTYSVTADWVARDGDLANLRGEREFRRIVEELRKREAALEDPAGGK